MIVVKLMVLYAFFGGRIWVIDVIMNLIKKIVFDVVMGREYFPDGLFSGVVKGSDLVGIM